MILILWLYVTGNVTYLRILKKYKYFLYKLLKFNNKNNGMKFVLLLKISW